MEQHHKTKAIIGVSLWVFSFPLVLMVFAIGDLLVHELWSDFFIYPAFYFIGAMLAQYLAFFWCGGHLARVKGYSTGILVIGLLWPAQLVILALLLFALPDKHASSHSRRKSSSRRHESHVDRVIRYRRNALIANILGLMGVLFALSLRFLPQGLFTSRDNAGVAAIFVFIPSYAAIINGCWWWVKAKNWHEAVVIIGLAPLAVLLVPYVRLIYLVVPLLLPTTMVLMPIILIAVVAVLPDKSGMPKRKRWNRD